MYFNRPITAAALAALLCVPSGLAVARASAPAAPAVNTIVPFVDGNLQTPLMPVTTSTHRKLLLSINIYKAIQGDPAQATELNISLETSKVPWFQTRTSQEHHEWFFSPQPSTVNMSQTTGAVSIATGKSLQPFTIAKMTFKPSKMTTCGTGHEYTGTLTGVIVLDTQTAAYDTIGSASHKVSFPKTTLDIPGDCGANPGAFPACETGFGWHSPTSDMMRKGKKVGNKWLQSTNFDRPGGKTSPIVQAYQEWQTPSKVTVFREDVISTNNAIQAYDATNHIVAAAGSGRPKATLTGSATLTSDGTSGGSSDGSCLRNGQTFDQHVTYLTTTTYANGTPNLAVHSVVNGAISSPDGAGYISEWTAS